jgi:hypothetical protein
LTARPHAHVRLQRAIERRALWLAEDAARELPNLPLEDALKLVHLYAERGSPKYERAALRWLERYQTEGSPGSNTSGDHGDPCQARADRWLTVIVLARYLRIEGPELKAGGAEVDRYAICL